MRIWSYVVLFVLFVGLAESIYDAVVKNMGQISDCFINYQGGFVRRGLLGEVLYQAYIIGFNPVILIVGILLIVMISMICFFVKKASDFHIMWQLLLPCCLLGGFVIYHIRKDYILAATFVILIYIYKKTPYISWIILANILTVISILYYEPFLLLCVPFFILLTNSKVKNWTYSVAAWSPSIMTFFLCCICKGNVDASNAIIKSISPYWSDSWLVSFIGKDAGNVFLFHIKTNIGKFPFGKSSFIFNWFGLFAMIYYCANAIPLYCPKANWPKRNIVMLMLFFLFCMIPMLTVLSTDYGRMLWFATMNSFAICFLFDRGQIESLFPKWMLNACNTAIVYIEKHIVPTKCKIMFIYLFVGVPLWSADIKMMFLSSTFGSLLNTCYKLMLTLNII